MGRERGGIQERRMKLEYVGRVGEEVSRTKEGPSWAACGVCQL